MTEPRTNSSSIWAPVSTLSLDTAVVATLWFVFLGNTFYLSLGRSEYYAFFLLLVGGSLLFNLVRFLNSGECQNQITRQLSALAKEKKILFILLPLIFFCALVLVYLETDRSVTRQLLVVGLLLGIYVSLLIGMKNIHFWGFSIPMLKASLLFFLFGAFLWPLVQGTALPLALGLFFLAVSFLFIFLREESFVNEGTPYPFDPRYLADIDANLPLLSLWALTALLVSLVLSLSPLTAVFYAALAAAMINLFLLFQIGKNLRFYSFRLLSRALLVLPLVPSLW